MKHQVVLLGGLIMLSAILGCSGINNTMDLPVTTASLSGTAFDFGNNLVNSTLTQTVVTVTNTGATTMTMSPGLTGDPLFDRLQHILRAGTRGWSELQYDRELFPDNSLRSC